MNCFLFYSILFYLSYVLATEFDLICPTPRRLLLGNRVPSGSVDEKKSSPPKYARSGLHESSSAYIRPKTTHEHKERSYSHLLKSKEKKSHEHRSKSSGSKKKKHSEKKVNVTGTASTAVKTRGLVAVKPNELERCRALLHIESIPTTTPPPSTVKSEKTKIESPKKVKETKEKAPPVEEKSPNKKNKGAKEPKEERRAEPSSTPAPTTSTAAPPPPVVKTKREKTTTPPPPVVVADEDEILPSIDLSSVFNHSMVDRAIHFVKNIFQLSDDVLEIRVPPKSPSIPPRPDQDDVGENIHRSRKLLSIHEDHFQAVRFSSRRLLATKTPEKKSVAKKSKSKATTTAEQTKPKVGWAYRYRISRYLAAQKMPRTRKKPVESKVTKKKSHRQNRNT